MNWMLNLVVMLQIVAALAMIGLVLVQHGKGADMGASFGSGASGSLFGATGSANFLSRSTAVCAAIFFVCTLLLAYLSNDRMMRPPIGQRARPSGCRGRARERAECAADRRGSAFRAADAPSPLPAAGGDAGRRRAGALGRRGIRVAGSAPAR